MSVSSHVVYNTTTFAAPISAPLYGSDPEPSAPVPVRDNVTSSAAPISAPAFPHSPSPSSDDDCYVWKQGWKHTNDH